MSQELKSYSERLADKGVFKYSMERGLPPAEKKSNVVQFEYTTGCKNSSCGFCDLYKDQEYSEKRFKTFKQHADKVMDTLESEIGKKEIKKLERIFVGNGNALAGDTNELSESIQYAIGLFKKRVGQLPRRVAAYGNIIDIVNKGSEEMNFLRCGGTCSGKCSQDTYGTKAGLDLLYVGLESGSDEVLKFANKGYTHTEVQQAIEIINSTSDLRTSVMIMPGLAGMRYYDEHVEATIEALNMWRPEWITFMGTKAAENTPYAKKMAAQTAKKINRELTPQEMTEQTAAIVEGIEFRTIVGVYDNSVMAVGENPVTIGTMNINSPEDVKRASNKLRGISTPEPLHRIYSKDMHIIMDRTSEEDIDKIIGQYMELHSDSFIEFLIKNFIRRR